MYLYHTACKFRDGLLEDRVFPAMVNWWRDGDAVILPEFHSWAAAEFEKKEGLESIDLFSSYSDETPKFTVSRDGIPEGTTPRGSSPKPAYAAVYENDGPLLLVLKYDSLEDRDADVAIRHDWLGWHKVPIGEEAALAFASEMCDGNFSFDKPGSYLDVRFAFQPTKQGVANG